MKWRWLILIAVVVLVTLHQNCANVGISRPPLSEVMLSSKGNISLCLENDYSSYTLESVMAANLNLVNQGKDIDLDSDGDGMSDTEEVAKGFNPLKRRTSEKFLDKVCLKVSSSVENCDSSPLDCSTTNMNMLGLSECDMKVLGLDQLFGHPNQGVDSDKDGVVDLLEIVRNTLPNEKDNLGDPDHDLIVNSHEIGLGSNPHYYDQPFVSTFKVDLTVEQEETVTSCNGELWTMQINSFPWIKAWTAFTDESDANLPSGALSLSRPENTNVGVIILRLVPKLGETGNTKFLIRPLLLSDGLINLNGSINDFIFAGEVLP